MELAYLSGRGKVYAITGTNGKTTTTALLGSIPVLICAATKDRLAAFIELPQSVRVYVSRSLLNDLDALLGENRYTIKPKDDVPQPRRQWRRDKESESEPASA